MTNKEKYFIESWEEQKEGPKWKYYLQYGFAWTIVIFLGTFFLLKILLDAYIVGSLTTLYVIAPGSVLMAIALTHIIYKSNEHRYRKILSGKKNEVPGINNS